jgi:glutamate/tyrosine decarboxylase-like PLP-dependent enzyme
MDTTVRTPLDALERAAAHALAYRRDVARKPAGPTASYADMRQIFSAPTPEEGCDAATLIDELVRAAEPGLAAMAGPRFFGWVIGASHPAGVAADWLTSAWGQNATGHLVTPAVAAVEEEAARWLLDLLQLPPESSVGFVTAATTASFTCLAAARSEVLRRVGWDVETAGLIGAPTVQVVLGADAHIAVFAALQYLGLGRERVIRVPSDDAGRIRAEAFAAAVRGVDGPMIAVAQAGHVNTGAFDPFPELVAVARERGAWLHVDGAFGLWARACPELAPLAAGVEGADSWAVDGHKWLQTPYDTGYAIVRDAAAHSRALGLGASYLVRATADERRPSDFTPELSRRARGFPTWAMIRALGRRGIAEMVAHHCRLARRIAARLAAEPGIAVLNEVELNQMIVRFGAGESPERGDRLTGAVIEGVQRAGVCFAAGADWRGQAVMRLSVISGPMTEADADQSAESILATYRAAKG